MSLDVALKTRDLNVLPSRRDEDWRWSDLRSLLRELPDPSPPSEQAASNKWLDGFAGARRLFINGRSISTATSEQGSSEPHGILVRRFVSVTDATAHHVEADLAVAQDGQLLLVDSFEGQASGYLASAAGLITLAPGARAERLVILDDAEDAISVSNFRVELAAGASFAQTVLASGAKRQRTETRVTNTSKAQVRLDGVYLLTGRRVSDQTTEVVHDGPTGESRQLVKGMVSDQARSIFQGRIIVARGADGTDAKMGSHAILLSDRAEVDAKPELEIYADDVQCAHGATVGALDEDALFYARARGVPEKEAKAMLARAFVADVAERILDEQARALALKWIEERLQEMV